MLPRKTFIYFLLDTPSGKAYYRNNTGTVSVQVIAASGDVSLQNAPANWQDTELDYDRNTSYHGIQRSFSTPMDFVRDSLQMIKELFLLGYGTETPLSLVVFKYNSQPQAGEPTYKLYFKSNIDLSTISETVLETLTASLMEGGVMQLLKSYEGTTLQIPCDGSIPENQKINFDGALVSDTFYYKVTPINNVYPGTSPPVGVFSPLSATYLNDDGDNYGIVHNDPGSNFIFAGISFDYTGIATDAGNSLNYLFYSSNPITVQLSGNVIIRSYKTGLAFQLMYATSAGICAPLSDKIFGYNTKEKSINFNQSIKLAANEKLFIYFQIIYVPAGGDTNNYIIDFLGGNFSIAFNSMATPTSAWAISFADLFKLILKQICLLSSTQIQQFNYHAISQLLNQYSNFFAISGDSLRASGDPSYQNFYSTYEVNQILFQTYGPVIKITLKDFFTAVEALFCAEMQSGNNGVDTLEIETLDSIYNSEEVDFDIGEVASLKWNFANDLAFSDFKIGYNPQTYDQKAGKYEWNTTLEMKAPINSFQKNVSKICPIRFDSYGIEKLRSNTGDATSTTCNDSDSDVFGVNVDIDNWNGSYDFFNALFISVNQDPTDQYNTNINYFQLYNFHQQNIPSQSLTIPITNGDYFQPNSDQAIIIFTAAFPSQSGVLTLTGGNINSVNKPPLAPPDTFTIKLWHNGVMIYSYTTTVTGVNTPIKVTDGGAPYNFTESFGLKDSFYITMETSDTCVADSITGTVTFPSTSIVLSFDNVPVNSGTPQKLLSYDTIIPTNYPYVIGTSFIQYGFQYFTFVSGAANTVFTMIAGFQFLLSNDNGQTFEINVYVNGILQPESILVTDTAADDVFETFSQSLSLAARQYKINDIVFFTVSVNGADLNAAILTATVQWNSTQIKLYSLKRVQYDSLSGIPNLATTLSGEIRSDIPGAPYNIEDVTPKLMYDRWKNYIMSTFLDKVTGDMIFQTLSKNQYLSRSYNGVTITENSNESVLDAKRLFYPIEIEVGTNVPKNFAELMAATKNAHIHCTFMGNDIYFFSDSLKQKPALNESQTWKGILSPKTDLIVFANINSFKIPDMTTNSISCAFASPLQFVPYNNVLATKYHTYSRNEFLFQQQIGNWLNKDNYGQPVQIGDPLTLQFITNGLSTLTYSVYSYTTGNLYLSGSIASATSAAIADPYSLWQQIIDTSAWARDIYYILINVAGIPVYTSEPLLVCNADELADTVLIEATNSFNTQGVVFDTGFVLSMRFKGGFDNKFKQKYLGKFYTNQPQDITVLNAIPYETTTLLIGRDGGIPDYVAKKVLRMLLMDGCMLDGEGYSLDESAQLEQVFTKGAPMKFQSIEIRPSKNINANSATPSGVSNNDSSLIVSVDPQSFGPNVTNSSGSTDADLIEIIVND